jgi:hypothetical protein
MGLIDDVSRKLPARRLRRMFGFLLYNIATVLVLSLMFEGAASTYYAFRSAFAEPSGGRESLRIFKASGHSYTEYDRDLGWVSLPNVYIPDMYGPGKFLRTNSQRFRNTVDFTRTVPPGQTRIICSGDSFTFGFGVGNDHTWPQLLASQAPNIETVNMGQGGYGADQAYLWYKRDGAAMDHDIQILALIYADVYRMQYSSFSGYGKPLLKAENDRVVVTNVPVPRSMEVWAPRLLRVENALSHLSVIHLIRSALKLNATGPLVESDERNEQTAGVLSHMLDDLRAMNQARGSVFVLVYLPTREELGSKSGYWRHILAQYARQRRVVYIDLTDDFRRLPAAESDKLFINNVALGTAGHYNEAGNAFVADLVFRQLLANPETAAKLHAR